MAQDNYDDIESLLEIAEKTRGEIKFEDSDADKFIRENEIKSGDTFVHAYLIYYMYHLWNPRKKLSKNTFFKLFKKQFTRKTFRRERGYLLDPSNLDLSNEFYFRARIFTRNQNAKKENKKKPS